MVRTSICVLLLILSPLGLCAGTTDGPPAITYVSEGVRHWEACYVFGEGFQAKGLQLLAWDPKDDRPARAIVADAVGRPPQPPTEPPEGAKRLTDRLQIVSPQAIACVYRDGWIKVLWAKTAAGVSKPYVTNRPKVFFIERTSVRPGQTVRIVGRNLLAHYWKPSTSVWLVPAAGGDAVEADVGYAEGDSQQHMNYEMDYIVRLRIPDDIPDGKYRAYVYVGQGGPSAWPGRLRSP